MTTHGELTFEAPKALAVQQQEPGLLSIIAGAVCDPTFDIGKLERLIALKERTDEQTRRNAFAAAMSRLQAKLPQIEKHGKIMSGTAVRSTFAKMEDLDQQIRPYLAEEGFAFSYDTAPGNATDIRIIGKLSHCDGHFELKQIDLPIDDGGAKSKVQMRGSTLSYGIRTLLRMHLNLVMKEEDNDGMGDCISAEQARTINDLMAEVGADVARFKKHFGIEKVSDLRGNQLQAVHAMLDAKRRGR